MTINAASGNQIKRWKKLTMSKYRKREKRFIAEGQRCVEQILTNRILQIEAILLQEGSEDELRNLLTGIPQFTLPEEDFISVTDTQTPQGVAAVCITPEECNPDDLAASAGPIVALDAIQDPGNLGTIIRTASWFGASGMLVGEGTADLFHPKVVRSTAGATGSIPYRKGKLSEEISRFESAGFDVCLLDGSENSVSINTFQPGLKSILVIGNEANGISQDLFSKNRTQIRIDGNTEYVESLNAAIAAGIALWHFTGSRG
jgi:TrmH family RNA methyltransferase